MPETSLTLLAQLKEPGAEEAWNRFVSLYVPLLMYWSRRAGLNSEDAADLVQEVLCTLVTKLPELEHDPKLSFRGWLRTVTLNKWRDQCRRKQLPIDPANIAEIAEPGGSSRFWIHEYRGQLVARALKLIQQRFDATTWKACWAVTVEGRRAAEVGKALGISAGAVYIAKCRVLKHLRSEMAGLWD